MRRVEEPQRGIVRIFPVGAMPVKLRWILDALAWLLLIPAIMLTAFLAVAQNDALYGVLQDRNGVNETVTGISDADRYRLNGALAAYLRGEQAELDDRAVVYGGEQTAFNDTERMHMMDVRNLFVLARRVCAGLWIGGTLLTVRQMMRRRRLLPGYGAAAGAWAAVLAGAGLWAVCDFTRAFVWFHRVLFSNELWILNPATDLMIRMLPEAFFAEMAAICAGAMLAAAVLAGVVAWAWDRLAKR